MPFRARPEDRSRIKTVPFLGLCMKLAKAVLSGSVWLAVTGIFYTPITARGELQWKRQDGAGAFTARRARRNHPTSSYFASEEIFIAEIEIAKDESRLVKLVNYLPYQPPLSENGSTIQLSTNFGPREIRSATKRLARSPLARWETGVRSARSSNIPPMLRP